MLHGQTRVFWFALIPPLGNLQTFLLAKALMGIPFAEAEERIREGLDTAVETMSAGMGSLTGFTSGWWNMNASCPSILTRRFLSLVLQGFLLDCRWASLFLGLYK